jgi:carbon-monoxide dehydrogenase medium subunit
MQPFDYFDTEHLSEVISTLVEYGPEAVLLAGGTDLLNMIRTGSVKPGIVVNLKNVSDLVGIKNSDDNLRLGALTKIKEVENLAVIAERYPALSDAANRLGSIQIRHVATIGGNLCRAAPCAETAPPLLIYGAQVHIVGPDGERTMPLEDYFTGPGEIALTTGEILKEIEIPSPGKRSGTAYLRHSIRPLMDLALVNVAVSVTLDEDGKTFSDARIALGSVAPTPIRALQAEEALRGEQVSEATIKNAAKVAADESHPISDVRSSADYRQSITRLFTRRAIESALARVNGGEPSA